MRARGIRACRSEDHWANDVHVLQTTTRNHPDLSTSKPSRRWQSSTIIFASQEKETHDLTSSSSTVVRRTSMKNNISCTEQTEILHLHSNHASSRRDSSDGSAVSFRLHLCCRGTQRHPGSRFSRGICHRHRPHGRRTPDADPSLSIGQERRSWWSTGLVLNIARRTR